MKWDIKFVVIQCSDLFLYVISMTIYPHYLKIDRYILKFLTIAIIVIFNI